MGLVWVKLEASLQETAHEMEAGQLLIFLKQIALIIMRLICIINKNTRKW